MYFEHLHVWHRIMLQPVTHLYVCSGHACLLSDNALSLRRLKGLQKRYIPGSNDILKWQHTGPICAV